MINTKDNNTNIIITNILLAKKPAGQIRPGPQGPYISSVSVYFHVSHDAVSVYITFCSIGMYLSNPVLYDIIDTRRSLLYLTT